MNLLKRLKGKVFSARSQGSYRHEAALRKELQVAKEVVSRCQRVVDNEQSRIDGLTKNTLSGEGWAAALIPKSRARISEHREQIAVFEPQVQKIQAAIDVLAKPSPAEAQERAENQMALATCALEQLECERKLAAIIRSAKGLLEKRSEITSRIYGFSQKVDLRLDADSIDRDVLGALERVVGCDLERQSEAWVDWLLGDNQKTEPHIVRDETIVFTETLASPNFFRRGDQVLLTAEQVAEIRLPEQTTRGNLMERLPGGDIRVGQSIEVRHARVEKIAEATQ